MSTLPYWIEHDENATATGVLWIKLPFLAAGQSTYVTIVRGSGDPQSPKDVFDFFDDFDSPDSTVWHFAATYQINNSKLLVQKGSIYMNNPLPFRFQDGYIAEALVSMTTPGNYGGTVPALSSKQYTAGNNGNATACILYMRGNGSTTLMWWAADGSGTGYSLGYGTGANTTNNVWYKTAISVTEGAFTLWLNDKADFSRMSFTWKQDLRYMVLGAFSGDPNYDVQDTTYEWLRVRKYVTAPPTVTPVESIDSYAVYQITNESATDLVDYQIALQLPFTPSLDESLYVSEGYVVPYWIEHDQLKRARYVWITVPALAPHSSTQLTVYRKPGRTPSGSDVFVFFDDFTDLKDWSVQGRFDLQNTELSVQKGSVYRNIRLPFSFIAETNVYCGPVEGSEDVAVPALSSAPIVDDENTTQEAVLSFARHGKSRTLSVRIASGASSGFDFADYTGRVEKIGWYRLGVSYRNGTVKLWKDGQVVAEVPGVSFTKQLGYLILGHHLGQNKEVDARYDWIRVRPYVEPEPTIEVQDLGFCHVVTVTNNSDEVLVGFPVAVPAELLGVEGALESLYIVSSGPISFSYWYEESDELWLWIVVRSFVLEQGGSLKIYLQKDGTSTPDEPVSDATVVEPAVLASSITRHYSVLVLRASDTYAPPFAFRVPARLVGLTQKEGLSITITRPAPFEALQVQTSFTVTATQGNCRLQSANYGTIYCSRRCPFFKRTYFLAEQVGTE